MLLAVCKTMGKEDDCIPRIAYGFGGGMGRQGEACGAVTGMVMATGLFYALEKVEEREVREAVRVRVGELMRQFAAVNGAVRCRDLLGLDLNSPEGLQAFRARNLREEKCLPAIKNAVRLVMEE